MASKGEKMPRGLRIDHPEGGLRLRYADHRGPGVLIFLAGLFWTAMLIPSARFLATGDGFGFAEALTMLPFLAMAFGFCYVGLAKMLNTAEILIGPSSITVRHAPLPWFGQVEVPLSEVESFAVKRDLKPRDVRHRVTLALTAERRDGTQRALLRAIADGKAAKRMHQEATAYLTQSRA